MIEKQLSMFDIPQNEVITELTELSSQYLIDNYYKKLTFGKTLTLYKIEQELTEITGFSEYIDKVYEILKNYYSEIIEESKTDFQTIGIAKRENSIRIYQPNYQYSIWCISMIDSEFYKYIGKGN